MRDKSEKNMAEFRRQNTRKSKLESVNSEISKIQKAEIVSLEEYNIWENIINTIPDWVLLTDLEGHILQTNKAGEKFISIPAEKILGQKCCKIIHGSKKFLPGCPLKKMLDTGEKVEAEFQLFAKNRWIAIRVNPVTDNEGRIIKTVHIIRDITEQRKTREILIENEKKFRSIFNNANDIIVFVNRSGKLLEINNKIKDILGYEPSELIGKNFLTCGVLAVRNASKIIKLFTDSVIRGGFPDKKSDLDITQVWINHKDGHSVEVEASTTPIRKDGKLKGFVSILRDITERRQVEEVLRVNEERFKGIFENSLVGIYRTSPDGKILMANPAIVKMLGYNSFEELAQINLEEYGFPQEQPRSEFLKQIEEKGQVVGFESVWCKKDGSTLFVRESAKSIRDKDGNTIYYEGTVEDVTERKKAEDALRKSDARHALAQRIAGIGTWEWNIETNEVYWSGGIESIFGFERGQFDGVFETVRSLIHPEDLSLWQNSV